LQYDFLYHVFAAQERVFTDPTLSLKEDGGGDGGSGAVTFRDLYVHALMSSPRCSKALREKMQETPEFATDFAKMSLLANVGRVNTTMTCLCPFCSSIYHLLTAAPPSSSGDAHGITYLSSRPFAAESRCESPRRPPHKEHS
jgi:Ino eighty subunit 1